MEPINYYYRSVIKFTILHYALCLNQLIINFQNSRLSGYLFIPFRDEIATSLSLLAMTFNMAQRKGFVIASVAKQSPIVGKTVILCNMKINEIFTSIQGETSFAGLPFTFVRLTGCNLRCSYCDTQYAYEEGTEWSIDQVLSEIQQRGILRIVVTGGEPLLQNATYTLCSQLADRGFMVLLETNGSMSILNVDRRVHRILDLKCPGSGMDAHMDFKNIGYLTLRDEVKFVISDRNDFQWALAIIKRYNLEDRTQTLISPAHQVMHPSELAEWIMQEKLNARLQLQLQKYIWPDRARGV